MDIVPCAEGCLFTDLAQALAAGGRGCELPLVHKCLRKFYRIRAGLRRRRCRWSALSGVLRVPDSVLLHKPREYVGIDARQRHDDGDLEEDPDAGSVSVEAEHAIGFEVLECLANQLVRDGRKDEEPSEAPGEPVPAFIGVMKCLLEDIFEEVLAEVEPDQQECGKHGIEDRDLDLHPHGVAGENRQGAEHQRDGGGDQREGRQAPQDAAPPRALTARA